MAAVSFFGPRAPQSSSRPRHRLFLFACAVCLRFSREAFSYFCSLGIVSAYLSVSWLCLVFSRVSGRSFIIMHARSMQRWISLAPRALPGPSRARAAAYSTVSPSNPSPAALQEDPDDPHFFKQLSEIVGKCVEQGAAVKVRIEQVYRESTLTSSRKVS